MGKETVSSAQLTTLIVAFLLGSSLVSGSSLVVRSGWVATALGTLESLLFALVFLTLSERFGHQNFVRIARQACGPVVGAIISLLFLWFVVQLGGLVLGHFGFYFNITVLQQFPTVWFIIPLALASVFCVLNGVGVMARAATMLLPITLLALFLVSALLLPQAKPSNLLPVIDTDWKTLLMATHGAAVLPLAELAVFMMLLPQLPRHCRAGRPVLAGLVFGGLLLTLVNFINVAVLGASIQNTIFPAHAAARLIEAGEVFARMEILVAINLLSMGFIKMVVLLYGAAGGLAELLGLRSYQPLVLPLGSLMVVLAVSGFRGGYAESMVFVEVAWPFYVPLFMLGLPLLVLLTALVRGKPGPAGRRPQ